MKSSKKIMGWGGPMLALAVGLAAGFFFRSLGRSNRSEVPAAVLTDSADSRRRTVEGGDAPAGHRLADLKRAARNRHFLPEHAIAAIERMPTPELREWLTQVVDSSKQSWPNNKVEDSMAAAAIEELLHRDTEGSLKWASELPDAWKIRVMMVTAAGASEPLLVKKWKDLMGLSGGFSEVDRQCYAASTQQSAEAALAAEKLFVSDAGGPLYLQERGFAEGFDFKKFISGTSESEAARTAVRAWAATDADAAYRGLRDSIPGKPELLGTMVDGKAAVEGEVAAAQWLAGKLDDLPADQRAGFVESVVGARQIGMARIEGFMTNLPRDEDRVAFAGAAYLPNGMGMDEGNLKSMQMLGSSGLQVQALQVAAQRSHGMVAQYPDSAESTWTAIRATMDQLHLSEEAKEAVHATLVSGGG